jgi:sugar O-acyltransferase (sialic acid O-acetyltransferase NeuD family)
MAGLSPGECERIIIVGAGGFGREVLQWARHTWPMHTGKLAGFLSADPDKLHGHVTGLPILGSPQHFEPRATDRMLLAIGIPRVRRLVAEQLEANGGRFLTLIHPSAIVADTARVGVGTIICPYAIVSDAVRLGRFVLVNYHSSLGHDARAGDFAVLSPHACLGGRGAIAEDVFLGLHASVGPGISVGSQSKVSANSSALISAPAGSIVFGVPGRTGPYVSFASEGK